MPYISKKDRPQYHELLQSLAQLVPSDHMQRAGHLNYVITQLLRTTYGQRMRYADHNEVIGVLECIKQEFYRRATAPYEDEKIVSEGDVETLNK